MASSSSSHQQNQELNAFSGIEPAGQRRKVCESSRLFDVFINHRGPDVKQTLATELYNSLRQLGIEAFLDSQEKELGTSFPSTIETAIRSAKVHIAIFSKRYAESPWCLAELVLMLETKAKIIPVFYEVEPWELRYIEKGVYADAFIKYKEEDRNLEKLNEWKEALQTLSFISGEVFHSFSDYKTIIAAVEKEVQRNRCLHVAKYPLGLNNLVEDFERQCLDELVQDFENQCGLEERKHKPKVVGIFGMGGLGKTTLAKELFNRKRSNFSGASFLFDVREASVRSELPCLQSQLVKDLFHKEQSFRNIEEGTSYLKDSMRRSPELNFLIVVDDIDHVDQLDALSVIHILNKSDNSLVIVTTRDVGVVISVGIAVGYPLKGMDRNHGRQLFCWHAFDRPIPCTGYEALVEQFVDVCGGLPLSLQVLGRLVHGRPHRYWELKLIKAREMLPRDVKQRLRISFDALDDEEKQVFIDIACFFLDKPKCMAERICEASGWDAQNALETLKDKCLVVEEKHYSFRLKEGGEIVLRMHDHLRDLGREMALELSSPHRLWHPRDLESLDFMGLETILAKTNARCFYSIFDDSISCHVTFFLGQSDSCVETSASLLWLELTDDITEQPSIPSWIPLQHLQCLKIFGGRFTTLWENRIEIFPDWHQLSTSRRDLQSVSGSGDPIKLRELLIKNCHELEELPSLSKLNCMEKIEIDSCYKLQNITLPTTLISLSVQNCIDLQTVVGSSDLIKLREVIIKNCPELEELPSLSRLNYMENIEIDSCDNLQNIMLPTTLVSSNPSSDSFFFFLLRAGKFFLLIQGTQSGVFFFIRSNSSYSKNLSDSKMMQPTPGAGPPLADANTQQQQQQQWMQHQQMMMDMQQQQVNQGMVMQQQQPPPQQQHHPQAPYQQQQAFYPNQPQYQQQQQPMQIPPQQQHQQPMSSDEVKTLWVGDLLFWMDENYLHSCFAHTGEVLSAKVIRNKHTGQSEGYGFMEFVSRASAEKILHSYNGTVMPNTEQAFRLNWASFSMGERRTDGGPDHSIFVGDLASDVTDLQLQETFQTRYPSVKGAKVVIDSVTGRSKGYGFVRFGDENERARAMSEMNGQYCSTRPMRISAATPRKSAGFQQPYPSRGSNGHQSQGFQSDPDINNTTIFVGGLDPNATDDDLRQIFGQYGELVSVKIPVGKGCGFVQFGTRASAEEALQRLHGTIIGQQTIRLSWGRSPANKQQQQQHQGQPQADPNQWNGAYYGQGYETYGYAPPPQDPAMYAYGAYPGYGNYHQQVS